MKMVPWAFLRCLLNLGATDGGGVAVDSDVPASACERVDWSLRDTWRMLVPRHRG